MDWLSKIAELWPLTAGLVGVIVAVSKLFSRMDFAEKQILEHSRWREETNMMIINMREESRKSLEEYAALEREEHQKIIASFEAQTARLEGKMEAGLNKIEGKIDTLVAYNLNNKS